MLWVKKARYVMSCPNIRLCPKDGKRELAFIGRSNVGKSSLINYLCGRPIAKTSATPGKTRLLNYFLINDNFYFVDMPGYGYAKVSLSERQRFQQLNEAYLRNRATLSLLCVLIDAAIAPQKIDRDFIEKIHGMSLPFAIIFTKTDKIRPSVRTQQIQELLSAFALPKDSLWVACSSHKKTGYSELTALLKNQLANSF